MRSCAWLIAAVALGLTVVGCGDARELSKQDARTLSESRADLDDALDTEETLRTSRAEALALRTKVQRIIGRGAFENGGKPDEFGLAALGQLRELVPSLVVERGNSVVRLDQPAAKRFLANAATDPAAALYLPAKGEVDTIVAVAEGDDTGPNTKIPRVPPGPAGNQTVSQYLRRAARDLRPVWPKLAKRLTDTRKEL